MIERYTIGKGFRVLWFHLWVNLDFQPTTTAAGWRLQLVHLSWWPKYRVGRFADCFYYLRIHGVELRAWPPGTWDRQTRGRPVGDDW